MSIKVLVFVLVFNRKEC